ncbi:uncharacterized protein MONBRDRAFT_30492 [Monosiga brevicollis MX1]|uniref:Uncharacterized protein n=1 Tax=Monosiga brevicollis TaxID=81824 RepID=A9VE30_MONBE|nr:uncharacterized protein MONBRDRAFT_30492 [Monosiga brevicollis MX1]EDQ84192.1 predicted protein [Monosiga brevicollis MX1]|eukprot:XP_001750980.1 hypothetical protein [Monosiga brevicollis MX1]
MSLTTKNLERLRQQLAEQDAAAAEAAAVDDHGKRSSHAAGSTSAPPPLEAKLAEWSQVTVEAPTPTKRTVDLSRWMKARDVFLTVWAPFDICWQHYEKLARWQNPKLSFVATVVVVFFAFLPRLVPLVLWLVLVLVSYYCWMLNSRSPGALLSKAYCRALDAFAIMRKKVKEEDVDAQLKAFHFVLLKLQETGEVLIDRLYRVQLLLSWRSPEHSRRFLLGCLAWAIMAASFTGWLLRVYVALLLTTWGTPFGQRLLLATFFRLPTREQQTAASKTSYRIGDLQPTLKTLADDYQSKKKTEQEWLVVDGDDLEETGRESQPDESVDDASSTVDPAANDVVPVAANSRSRVVRWVQRLAGFLSPCATCCNMPPAPAAQRETVRVCANCYASLAEQVQNMVPEGSGEGAALSAAAAP